MEREPGDTRLSQISEQSIDIIDLEITRLIDKNLKKLKKQRS